MEHRWFRRIDSPIDVIIHTSDDKKYKYRIHNISQGGVLMDHADMVGDKNRQDLTDSVVNIEFREDSFKAVLPAFIVRQSADTAAVMFTEFHPGLRKFLEGLRLHAETVPSEKMEVNSSRQETDISHNLRIMSSAR